MKDWKYHKDIVVSDTNVAADLADFPLLVAIDNDADIGVNAKADGSDLRFTLVDGTLLDFEFEYFDVVNDAASLRAWVRMPKILASGGAALQCWYGHPDPPAWEGDVAAVWTPSGHTGVWHFHDGSLANSVTGVNAVSVDTDASSDGLVAGCRSTEAYNDVANRYVETDVAPRNVASHTLEAWVRPTATPALIRDYFGVHGSAGGRLCLIRDGNGKWSAEAGNMPRMVSFSGGPISDQWQHVALVADGGTARLFIDGAADPTTHAYAWTLDNRRRVRWFAHAYACRHFRGRLDEGRYARGIARSAAWLAFEHANMIGDFEQTWGDEIVSPTTGFTIFQFYKLGVLR